MNNSNQWLRSGKMVGVITIFVTCGLVLVAVAVAVLGQRKRAKKAAKEKEERRERAAFNEALDRYSERWGNPYNEV